MAIEVTGFKSAMETVRVNFRDLTVLAGANSTGKSTIMQPLLMIKQTIEKPFDPGGLAIDGPLVRFTQAEQFLSHAASAEAAQTFRVKFFSPSGWSSFTYGRSATVGIDLLEMGFSHGDKVFHWTNKQTITRDELVEASGDRQWVWTRAILVIAPDQEVRVGRNRVTLAATMVPKGQEPTERSHFVLRPADAVVDQIRDVIHLPGLRGNPERHYAISAAGPQYPGNFIDYVASVIHQWTTTGDDRIKCLERNLKTLGLTWRVATRSIDDTRVDVRVGRLPAATRGGARDTVNIADVGFGVSQTLPVLVALLAANRDQIVSIEQPELHLHPRAQVALADIILQAVDRGVRVVIETHSSLLLLALQTLVAEGRLAPGRVSLNWFTRDSTGQTHVTEAQIAEDGSYGDWPEDFGTTELELQDRYMTLVERRHGRR
jgi:hypothetical protein